MSGCGILSTFFSRLTLSSGPRHAWGSSAGTAYRLISSNSGPLLFRATPCLLAEPLKKKKRIDPAVLKQREERRKKKIERQIRRLEKNSLQLKPVDECEVPLVLIDERSQRLRSVEPLTEEEQERRALLQKEWARFKLQQRLADVQRIDLAVQAQQRALDELRLESEDLYQEAIQPDLALVPFTAQGPTFTPPIPEYEVPDGDYADTTRRWD